MDTGTIIGLLVSLLTTLLCCGIGIFMLLFVLGIIILRRRGKKKVSVKEAVSAGAETVSQVFVRGQGGLEALGDDDDDD
ncbi:MAG: hypothetical protein R3F61_36440 [Myxococcota bacterium]